MDNKNLKEILAVISDDSTIKVVIKTSTGEWAEYDLLSKASYFPARKVLYLIPDFDDEGGEIDPMLEKELG